MAAAPDSTTLSLRELVRRNLSKRGLAIIITNEYLGSARRLVGTKKDGERMKIAFSRLDIANIWRQNVTKYQLNRLLKEVAEIGPCPATYESISFVFSGHGNKEVIGLEDGTVEEILKVIDAFVPLKSPQIAAIPKLFFIDACRGDETIGPVTVPNRRRERSLRYELQPQPSTFLIPPKGNCLVAYSTSAPYVSFDHPDGSKWSEILADTMCKSTDHIEDVLTQVRQDYYQNEKNSGYMQMPETRSTLLQKVYLNRVSHRSTRSIASRRAPEQPSRVYSGSQSRVMYASQSFFRFDNSMGTLGQMHVSQSFFRFENSMGTFGQQERLVFQFKK